MVQLTLINAHSAWSLCIGRISQLPRAAITLKKPLPDSTSGNDEYWRPFPDNPNLNLDRSNAPHLSQNHLYHLSLLSELVNDTVFMFYAPKDRFTSRKLLDQYSKYRSWYQNLPDCLRLNGAVPVAHVFDLQYVISFPLNRSRPFAYNLNQHVLPHLCFASLQAHYEDDAYEFRYRSSAGLRLVSERGV